MVSGQGGRSVVPCEDYSEEIREKREEPFYSKTLSSLFVILYVIGLLVSLISFEKEDDEGCS